LGSIPDTEERREGRKGGKEEREREREKEKENNLVLVAHACNPSYLID
jgi:hypothetical protein